MPLPLLAMPLPTKWTYVMGRPVHTSDVPVAQPTDAQVHEVQRRWEAEVRLQQS